ncbi:hypothetical protein I2I05_12870 [Hymenobacter sp. BT683]|uniref:Uncharacterized protein n=1 Tax=Hymenobacter jeongseonensis TaxID=2791027 RepID=A0ABS0IIU3_9BACT|nr:DUF6702 family protein [Hymenobacter jeongseonensis]MBF9238290.1 hypothetical protein [Hymenobacter jeongseonensis]
MNVRFPMRFLTALAALTLLATSAWALHAYHSSLMELRYNAGKKQLEVAVKVFTDDFEKALSQGQPAPVNLSEPGPRPLALTTAYLQRTLKFSTAAGALLPLQVLGLQQEKDGYWLYCKVMLPGPVGGVQLRQAMLLDVFGDQMNIVNVEAGDKKQSVLFRAGHEQELLTW